MCLACEINDFCSKSKKKKKNGIWHAILESDGETQHKPLTE